MRRVSKLLPALLVIGGLVYGAFVWRSTVPAPDRAEAPEVIAPAGASIQDYVGPQKCAPCHHAIYEQQSRSHMGNALRTIEEHEKLNGPLPEGSVYDSANDIEYQIVRKAEGPVMRITGGSDSREAPLTYVLGFGFNGMSFLHEGPDYFRELRLSSYTSAPEWDFTPSQEVGSDAFSLDEPFGRRFPKKATKKVPKTCVTCHSTLLVQTGGWIDRRRSVFGVTCERCHGPGREHIESAERGELVPPRNPRVAAFGASFQEMHLCGECHGGDKQAPDDLKLAMLAVSSLQQSKCYQRTPGGLRCTDCHDPHTDAVRGNPAHYVQVCLRCHSGVRSDGEPAAAASPATGRVAPRAQPVGPPVCPVEPQGNCISCHMPRRHPIYRSTFTHHRIAVHANPDDSKPASANGTEQ